MKKIVTFLIFYFLFLNISFSAEIVEDRDVFQESIDKNFKPIDKKIETYFKNLYSGKGYCFWVNKVHNFIDCTNDIFQLFSINWEFANSYRNACILSLWETIKKQKTKSIAWKDASELLGSENWELCSNLYEFKLFIYQSTAIDILKKNKYAINKNEHKLFTKQNRIKYDTLLDLIRINLGYIERMWKKWPSKTK